MPTYTYKCGGCGHQFDIRQKMSDDRLKNCPECNEPQLDKIITSSNGFQLKGKGWFGNSKTTQGY